MNSKEWDEHLIHFQHIKDYINTSTELTSVVKLLGEELQSTRDALKSDQKQIIAQYSSRSVSALYKELQDQNEFLKKQLTSCKQDLASAKEKHVIEMKEQYETFSKEKEKLELQMRGDNEIFEQTMKDMESQFKKREEEQTAALECAKSSHALICDDMESSYRGRLADVTEQLVQSNNKCETLRSEVLRLKTQLAYASHKEIIQPPPPPHIVSSESEAIAHDFGSLAIINSSLLHQESTNVSTLSSSNYPPLNVMNQKYDNLDNLRIHKKQFTTYRQGKSNIRTNASRCVQPLMPLNSNALVADKRVNKKRKLYNPDEENVFLNNSDQ